SGAPARYDAPGLTYPIGVTTHASLVQTIGTMASGRILHLSTRAGHGANPAPATGAVILQFSLRPRSSRDRAALHRANRDACESRLNAQWDLLLELTNQAWSWRDPESLDEMEQLLACLCERVLGDWSD